MRLPESYLATILAHAQEGRPNEVCGLIAGREGRATRLYRTTNSDPNPRVRYNVEPLELLNALREMEQMDWALMAIYHSHPATEAYPSATDIGLAYYPDAVYVIVSLAAPEEPVVRAFRIVDDKVINEPLEIEKEEPDSEVQDAGSLPPFWQSARMLSRAAGTAASLVATLLLRRRGSRAKTEEAPQRGEDAK